MVNTDWSRADLKRLAKLKKRATNREINAAGLAVDILEVCEDHAGVENQYDHLVPALTRQILMLMDLDENRKGGPTFELVVDGPPDPIIPRDCWGFMLAYEGVIVKTVLKPPQNRLN